MNVCRTQMSSVPPRFAIILVRKRRKIEKTKGTRETNGGRPLDRVPLMKFEMNARVILIIARVKSEWRPTNKLQIWPRTALALER